MGSPFEEAADALLYTNELSFKTRGRSMEPLFREHRDIINITAVDRELKKGDVVLYSDKRGITLILHRVIGFKDGRIIIRGDNNYFIEKQYPEEIIGIMKSFYREGKYCDVEKSKKYKLYTFWILHSYYLRAAWCKTRLTLGKIKVKIFGESKKKQP